MQSICPICHHDEMVDGALEASGRNHFRPADVKFWTLKDINIKTTARMCARCGAVVLFGDLKKLASLKEHLSAARKDDAPGAEE